RTRGERPSDRSTAEECDERAPLHPVHSRASGNPGATLRGSGSPLSRGRTELDRSILAVRYGPGSAAHHFTALVLRCARDTRGELAAAHSITSSARPRSGSGIVRPSALAVL